MTSSSRACSTHLGGMDVGPGVRELESRTTLVGAPCRNAEVVQTILTLPLTTFREIESNRIHSPAQLICKVPIFASDETQRLSNDAGEFDAERENFETHRSDSKEEEN